MEEIEQNDPELIRPSGAVPISEEYVETNSQTLIENKHDEFKNKQFSDDDKLSDDNGIESIGINIRNATIAINKMKEHHPIDGKNADIDDEPYSDDEENDAIDNLIYCMKKIPIESLRELIDTSIITDAELEKIVTLTKYLQENREFNLLDKQHPKHQEVSSAIDQYICFEKEISLRVSKLMKMNSNRISRLPSGTAVQIGFRGNDGLLGLFGAAFQIDLEKTVGCDICGDKSMHPSAYWKCNLPLKKSVKIDLPCVALGFLKRTIKFILDKLMIVPIMPFLLANTSLNKKRLSFRFYRGDVGKIIECYPINHICYKKDSAFIRLNEEQQSGMFGSLLLKIEIVTDLNIIMANNATYEPTKYGYFNYKYVSIENLLHHNEELYDTIVNSEDLFGVCNERTINYMKNDEATDLCFCVIGFNELGSDVRTAFENSRKQMLKNRVQPNFKYA